MNLIKSATVAVLLASFIGAQPVSVMAQGQGRRDRYEDKRDKYEAKRERERERERREERREEARREWREDRYNARENYREGYWDASRDYRANANRSYRARRMTRNDRIYRGSDNRYYCKRDDGTTGLIVGGVAGGVLGTVIAPGGSKILGAIIGTGAGALIGRAIDDGDMVCR